MSFSIFLYNIWLPLVGVFCSCLLLGLWRVVRRCSEFEQLHNERLALFDDVSIPREVRRVKLREIDSKLNRVLDKMVR